MADWYCSSVKYAAVAQFAINTAYTVGNIVRQLAAPAVGNERCFRCTTAGTSAGSEPSWNLTTGATTTSGTATFTEVTGNATYNWSAPFSDLQATMARAAAADRVFIGSDAAGVRSNQNLAGNAIASVTIPSIICVSVSGSVPPVAADLATTAVTKTTDASSIAVTGWNYFYGVGFDSNLGIDINANGDLRFDYCNFIANTTVAVYFNSSTQKCVYMRGSTVAFRNVAHKMQITSGELYWQNAAIVTGATIPTVLFDLSVVTRLAVLTFDGVDFSMLGSGKTIFNSPSAGSVIINCLNCKFDSAVTLIGGTWARGGAINLYGCEGLTTLINTFNGVKSTESTIVVSGQTLSWKIVTNANNNLQMPFESFPITVQNTVTGTPITVTVNVLNDGTTFNNSDLWLEAEYLGTGSSSRSSLATGSGFPLVASANWATSSATWTTTGISSPVAQNLTLTFTPQVSGLVRIKVVVARTSKTLYVSPKVTVT